MYSKFFSLLIACVLSLSAWGQQAKYVFYFIGDGMGVNQVNGTQTYLAALEGRIGTTPLCFTQFPYAALVTTYSATNGVTDSAAAGTALATGHKTKNGALGVLKDQQTSVSSIAVAAQQAGAAVGITTSVSVDHATPASFYAHQGARGSYYAIGQDLIRANFDLYAGSDFLSPYQDKNPISPSLYQEAEQAGYTLVRQYQDLEKLSTNKKALLLQPETYSEKDRASIPYAIDRKDPTALTLTQITQSATKFLNQKGGQKGFFLMVEGGKIDWACHANDAATVFHEVIDMDKAIQVAFDFYKQHPDETLIVVTADHETGGIVLGRGPYELHTQVLQYQKMSTEAYGKHFQQLHAQLGNKLTWEVAEKDLQENWGFGKEVQLTDAQQAHLKQVFEQTVTGAAKDAETLYSKVNKLADTAREIMAECALIGWQSHGHSNGYVPVFAIGAGAEKFQGQIDNTQIPQIISQATGWKMK